uniref:Protein XRP2 n=1 Tax=Plectus sambesii TaxID=2011161 RepID=A0A914UIE2_9BILA
MYCELFLAAHGKPKANIYLFDNTASVNIDDCTNCNIFIGPSKGSVFIRNCSQCALMVACQQFRTRDCQDLDVFLFCSTQPIIEESKQIRFACLQIFYEQLSAQLDSAALSVFNNSWSKIHDFTPSQGNCSCLPEDANPLQYISFTSTEDFSLPPVSVEREHSLIPLTLGIRPPPSREVIFVLCFSDGEGKKALRNRCLELVRIVHDNTDTTQDRVRFVQSKEVDASADDLERILGTAERKQLAGNVIGMELCGSNAATTVKGAIERLGWTQLAYVAESAVTKQQLAKFYSFADMKLGV